jgi:hypothetical protein
MPKCCWPPHERLKMLGATATIVGGETWDTVEALEADIR